MNRVVLLGKLVRDAEMKSTDSQKHFANFTIAVHKRVRPMRPDLPDSDYFSCRAWGMVAEHVGTYGVKGSRVSVDGRLESRRFTDDKGVQRHIVEVIVDTCQLIDSAEPAELRKAVS